MIKLCIAFIMVSLIGCSSSLTQEERVTSWTTFRGDTHFSGYSNCKLSTHPQLKWSYKSEKRTSSSPIISDGVTYWSDQKGVIYGVDTKGKLSFSHDFKTNIESPPLIHDSVLYIGSIDGRLHAISLNTKKLLWSFETMGQISSSPNYAKIENRSYIVIGSYDNNMYSIDAITGLEMGRYESSYYINGAIAIWKKFALFGGCDAKIRMIDLTSNKVIDSLETTSYIPASPCISNSSAYIYDYSGNIYELKLNLNGFSYSKIITSENENASIKSVPASSDDIICYFNSDSYLITFDCKLKTEIWKSLLPGKAGESSPIIAKDKVLVCTQEGHILIYNLENGAIIWEYDCGEPINASPAVDENRFIVLTTRGTLLCFGNNN